MQRTIKVGWGLGMSIMLFALLSVGCSIEEEPTDEFITRQPSIQPTDTVAPNLPTESSSDFIGRNNPTQAALAAEGQETEDAPTLIIATEVALPLQVFASDSQILAVNYYRGKSYSAPIVFLLHDSAEDGRSWSALAQTLQNDGYHVVVPDLRGHGQTGGTVDWKLAVSDMQYMLLSIDQLGTTDVNAPIGFVGVGTGANLALVSCASLPRCRSVVSVGPRTSSTELDSHTATSQISNRAALLLVSADDDEVSTLESEQLNIIHTGDHLWQRFGQGGVAGELFGTQPQLSQQITEWLRRTTQLS